MASLNAREMRKYEWRPEVFIRKLNEGSPFEMNSGLKVTLIPPEDVEDILRKGSNTELNELRFADTSGEIRKLTDFKKTAEFGGKEAGASTFKEDMALRQLREAINEEKERIGRSTVLIRIGSKTYNVYDVQSTPGTPKSDFHLVDTEGREIAWISHKDGTKVTHFQQWGGTSPRREPKISNHPETKAFVKAISSLYPKGLPPKSPSYFRKIKDERLKMMAIYGNDYGSAMGRQNVTLMLQGPVGLKRRGNYCEITSTHVHVNGERMTGEYEAVFMTRISNDRGDYGVKGMRLFIAPIGSRKAIQL